MLQEDGSPEPVLIDLDDPADADKLVPGARLRVSGTRNVPPGQQKEKMKRIRASRVQVLNGGGGAGAGSSDAELTSSGSKRLQAVTATVGTVQQLPVKLAVMKLLVIPSERRSTATLMSSNAVALPQPPPFSAHANAPQLCPPYWRLARPRAVAAPACHMAHAQAAANHALPGPPLRSQGECVPC